MATETRPPEAHLGFRELVWEMTKVFLLAVAVIIPVRIFLFQPFFVQGSSMEPNFEDGQYLIINEFGYKETRFGGDDPDAFTIGGSRTLERQDVAVFRYPENPDQFFIKRVIALPGEGIEIKGGLVWIYNDSHPEGFALDESAYLESRPSMADMERVNLGPEEYFVLGDNRMFSFDSRSFGPLPKYDIIGRVLVRAWPADKATVF